MRLLTCMWVCVIHSFCHRFVKICLKYVNAAWTIYITSILPKHAHTLSPTTNWRGCHNISFNIALLIFFYSCVLLSFAIMSGTLHAINTQAAVNFALFWYCFFVLVFFICFVVSETHFLRLLTTTWHVV